MNKRFAKHWNDQTSCENAVNQAAGALVGPCSWCAGSEFAAVSCFSSSIFALAFASSSGCIQCRNAIVRRLPATICNPYIFRQNQIQRLCTEVTYLIDDHRDLYFTLQLRT